MIHGVKYAVQGFNLRIICCLISSTELLGVNISCLQRINCTEFTHSKTLNLKVNICFLRKIIAS